MKTKEIITKRIDYMNRVDKNNLYQIIELLKYYSINIYNTENHFDFDEFKKQCIETYNLLKENKQQCYYFLSVIMMVTGGNDILIIFGGR
jgi:hypothetical protein